MALDTTPYMGHQANVGVGIQSGSISNGLVVETCGIGLEGPAEINADGIDGDRQEDSNRDVQGVKDVNGPLTWFPVYADLYLMLPWIFLGAWDSTTLKIGNTVTAWKLVKELGSTQELIENCMVKQATFNANQGAALQLSLDVIAKTLTNQASGTTEIPAAARTDVWTVYQTALEIDSLAAEFETCSLTINNNPPDIYFNSQSRSHLLAGRSRIEWQFQFPISERHEAIKTKVLAATELSAVLALTNTTGQILRFTSSNCRAMGKVTAENKDDWMKFPIAVRSKKDKSTGTNTSLQVELIDAGSGS